VLNNKVKKLLYFIVLGLLLTGCINKKETALENCADDRYQNFSEDSLASVFYDRKNTKIINVTKSYESAKIKLDEANDKSKAYLKKHFHYNAGGLQPHLKGYEFTTAEELGNYKKLLISTRKELLNKSKFWYREAAYLDKTLKELKYFSAIKMFVKAPLKRKINVNEYYIRFTECEKEHTEAPDAFVLRWKD
jgi:hypothetical protein